MAKDEKKVTATSIVKHEFSKKIILNDEVIIAAVKKACPDSHFGANQLAWYKSQARAGKLGNLGKIDIPRKPAFGKQPKAKVAKKMGKKKIKAKSANIGVSV